MTEVLLVWLFLFFVLMMLLFKKSGNVFKVHDMLHYKIQRCYIRVFFGAAVIHPVQIRDVRNISQGEIQGACTVVDQQEYGDEPSHPAKLSKTADRGRHFMLSYHFLRDCTGAGLLKGDLCLLKLPVSDRNSMY